MVGVRGFEPPTPSSRTMCATRLRYTPTWPQGGPRDYIRVASRPRKPLPEDRVHPAQASTSAGRWPPPIFVDSLRWDRENMGTIEAPRLVKALCMLCCITGFGKNDSLPHALGLLG
jgi:hypothetical protein